MNRSGLCVVGLVLACGPLPALAAPDQNTASSAYVARAFALTEQGEKAQSPAEALELYRQARAYLDAIPGTYPASRAAAEVVLGGPLEQRVDADIDRATRDVDAWKQALAAGIDQDLAELQRQSGELKPDSTDEEWGRVRQLADSLRERLAQKGAPARDVDPRRLAADGALGAARQAQTANLPEPAERWAQRAEDAAGSTAEIATIRDWARFPRMRELARAAAATGHWEDAREAAKAAFAAQPGDAEMAALRDRAEYESDRGAARTLAERGDWPGAAEKITAALAIRDTPANAALRSDPARVAEDEAFARRAHGEAQLAIIQAELSNEDRRGGQSGRASARRSTRGTAPASGSGNDRLPTREPVLFWRALP